MAPDGRPHLAQCKHHDDASAVCGSAEVSELPMALIKFGVEQGLFVTDVRISPQAKREYLQDYPKLALEFVDRDELVAEIVANPVLRALWFDGGKLGSVNGRLTFPVIVRRHAGDRPLLPLRHSSLRKRIYDLVGAEATLRRLKVEARESRSSRAPFEPYRPPRRSTMDEGFMSELVVTEIGFQGGVALHEIDALAEALAMAVAGAAAAEFDAVTVVVGAAYVTPLQGEHAGMRTTTNASRTAAVGIGTHVALEQDWFQPDGRGDWDATCDARVTESQWVRIYNRRIGVAAACEISTPPRPYDVHMRQLSRSIWEGSVFAILPKWDAWKETDVPVPDEYVEWRYEPGRMICGWLHPLARGGFVAVPTDPGDEGSLPGLDFDEESALTEMRSLRERIFRLGVEFVDADRARHMVALVAADPLLRDDAPTLFSTADVLAAFDGLASPIDPAARRGSLTMAWRCGEIDPGTVEATATSLAEGLSGTAEASQEDGFLVVELQIPTFPVGSSTSGWLEQVATQVDAALRGLPKPATDAYWAATHEVQFGKNWYESNKVFVHEQGPEGLKPVKVTREEIEDLHKPWPSADIRADENER